MFRVPHNCRVTNHPNPQMNSSERDGNNGCFKIVLSDNATAWIIASNGAGWEHVSVHIEKTVVISEVKTKYMGRGGKTVKKTTSTQRTPTWDEMCQIKDIFWGEEDLVVQYHPPKIEYVNMHNFTLHLWRPIDQFVPAPPIYMV